MLVEVDAAGFSRNLRERDPALGLFQSVSSALSRSTKDAVGHARLDRRREAPHPWVGRAQDPVANARRVFVVLVIGVVLLDIRPAHPAPRELLAEPDRGDARDHLVALFGRVRLNTSTAAPTAP